MTEHLAWHCLRNKLLVLLTRKTRYCRRFSFSGFRLEVRSRGLCVSAVVFFASREKIVFPFCHQLTYTNECFLEIINQVVLTRCIVLFACSVFLSCFRISKRMKQSELGRQFSSFFSLGAT